MLSDRTDFLEAPIDAIAEAAAYNVHFTSPGLDDRDAMPLGNGILAASVWTTASGHVYCYLARGDALSETDRTLKIGLVDIKISPSPFTEGGEFSQTLELTRGSIHIRGDESEMVIYVPPESEALYVDGSFPQGTNVSARLVSWRTTARTLSESDLRAFGGCTESADVRIEQPDASTVCHVNGETVVERTATLHGIPKDSELVPDDLTGRTFGARLWVADAVNTGVSLRLAHAESLTLRVTTTSALQSLAEACLALELAAKQLAPSTDARHATERWWNRYWAGSYVFIEGDEPGDLASTTSGVASASGRGCAQSDVNVSGSSAVTRAYILTRYMHACVSHGAFPMLYNGLLFTLNPGQVDVGGIGEWAVAYTAPARQMTLHSNPDDRPWCIENLWQNLRWPYLSMLARGETLPLANLFAFFRRFWELNRFRAREHYGTEGQHTVEMFLSFGLLSPTIFGEHRDGLEPHQAANLWGGRVELSPGLELAHLMLDYADFTGSDEFFRMFVEPFVLDIASHIDGRFPRDEEGHWRIGPISCLETYRDAINPMPVVAGLQAVIQRTAAHPACTRVVARQLRRLLAAVPPLPSADSLRSPRFLPAVEAGEVRHNVEAPELYVTVPFDLIVGVGDRHKLAVTVDYCATEYGLDAPFPIGSKALTPSYSGWQYLGIAAARAGQTARASRILRSNCNMSNPGMRFPAMWGPIYDGVPDTDHGANILCLVQAMLLHQSGANIRVLPAFPKNWQVSARLHLDSSTVIELAHSASTGTQWRLSGGRPGRSYRVEVGAPTDSEG